jgi:hypothetical protein
MIIADTIGNGIYYNWSGMGVGVAMPNHTLVCRRRRG